MDAADDALAAAVLIAVLVPTVIALRLLRTIERLSGVKPLTLRRRPDVPTPPDDTSP
jgi:hypothetical protein